MHRSIRRTFTGPSPAIARACQLMRAVGGTRSQMTASPRSYDLLLHRLISDFSTELSPVCQPVLHLHRGGGEAIHGSSAGSTGNGSGALIPASGYRKHRAAYDGCKAR